MLAVIVAALQWYAKKMAERRKGIVKVTKKKILKSQKCMTRTPVSKQTEIQRPKRSESRCAGELCSDATRKANIKHLAKVIYSDHVTNKRKAIQKDAESQVTVTVVMYRWRHVIV